MRPRPRGDAREYTGSGKLTGKVAIITGGDSGIGRAVAVMFAKEGADVMVAYRDEHEDANDTRALIDETGRRCVTIDGDIGKEAFCRQIVRETLDEFGRLDIVVNNAAEQHPQESIEDITAEQLQRTFETNIFSMFYLTKAALPHLKEGSAIVNTTSITAYRGSPKLIDYASTKGAIVAFTRSLATQVLKRGIRVNAVAPGPIWTPLIPASYEAKEVAEHGSDAPMERAGQPDEVAPSYVFLASNDSSYMSGQVLHPNGGEIING
jgi:NAD(P)-dependent dehydrogenase (short-subunit alcohol dehydrogenase family)